MPDDRIKPTPELRCTEACPSYNAGTCMVTGYHPNTVQNPGPASGEAAYCHPATDALTAEYRASMAKPARQEYRVVSKRFTDLFENQVNDLLADGWVLHGATRVTSYDNGVAFVQALVREVREEGEQ